MTYITYLMNWMNLELVINNFEVHALSFAFGYFIGMFVSIFIMYIIIKTGYKGDD